MDEGRVKKLSHLQLMLELGTQEKVIANAYSRRKQLLAEVTRRVDMLVEDARRGKFPHDMEVEDVLES